MIASPPANVPQVTLIQPPITDPAYPAVPFGIEPLSLLLLAALTPTDRFTVRVLDGMIPADARSLVDPASALVGITVVTPVRQAAYELAAHYRRLGIPVVLGGCHVTLDPEDAAPHADAIVVGEAKELWPRVLVDFENGALLKRYEATRPSSFDVPADRSPITHYRRRYPFISIIQTTRGCPRHCDFCVPAVYYGQELRHRSIDSVVAELQETRRRFGRKTFGFTDDNLFGDREYARRLLEALKPLRIRWAAQMCIDVARDDSLLELMAESGCFAGFFGLESVNPEALDEAGKPARNGEYATCIRKLRERGILVIGSFTIGYDCDTECIYDDTIAFCRETGIEIPLFVALMPHKGTRFFERLVTEGRLAPDAWPGTNPLAIDYTPRHLDPARVGENLARMYREAYDRGYLWRSLKHWLKRGELRRGLLLVVLYGLYVAFARRIGKRRYLKASQESHDRTGR